MFKKFPRALLVLAVCAAVALGSAATAGAIEATSVPNHAIVGSVDLYGMSIAQARAAISAEASVTRLPALKVKAVGTSFTLDASKSLVLDVDAMLARACTPSVDATFTLKRICTVSATPVSAFTSKVAKSVKRSKRDAKYYVKSGKLKWRKAVYGRKLRTTDSKEKLNRELLLLASTGTARPVVTLPVKSYKPKVTNSKLGRAILVDLSKRKLWLYDHSKVKKKYGVAIGMPGHTTPRGKFKVIAKAKNPAWRNPGSGWAANMPAYIAPGPRNPLGTRALYINSPGIRIHGTHKTWSIGHAQSHGCVRVANRNIEKLYPLVPVGTPVFIIK
jgi:lipoprotein-anchoring transpeptidase ErfK/SrfK